MERATRILTSAGFLAGLALLLANDFVLKRACPGLLTGKLSDFAGLFIFPMFWAAVWPRRTREIYAATALAFVWWKSPLSQSVIDHWNNAFAYHVARVVDITDLIALAALPLSAAFARGRRARSTSIGHRHLTPLVMIVSLFAFGGSIFGGIKSGVSYTLAKDDPTATYALASSFDEFPQRLDATGLFHYANRPLLSYRGDTLAATPDLYVVSIDNDCRHAMVQVTPLFNETAVRLDELRADVKCKSSSKSELRIMFESEVLPRLRGDKPPLARVTQVDGEQFDYPADARPSIELNSSFSGAARRLDNLLLTGHELHDGVYQLSATACYGRFRMVEEPDKMHVLITGLGFQKPCFNGASLECLSALFRNFITIPSDRTRTPTPASTPTAQATCPAPVDTLKDFGQPSTPGR